MKSSKKNLMVTLGTILMVVTIGITYAFITQTLTGTKEVVINAGVLDLVLEEENAITISDALPMYDEVGMIQEPFTFSLVNNGSNSANYKLKLIDVTSQTVEHECSELEEITLDSPAECRETIYPEELRNEALTFCQTMFPPIISITNEADCVSMSINMGAPFITFEGFMDYFIENGEFKDTRTLVDIYPNNVYEAKARELYSEDIRYGLTRNGKNTIGSISDMEYQWKIDNSEMRAKALEICKYMFPKVTDEASCLQVNNDNGGNFETFDDIIPTLLMFNGGKNFILDEGTINGNETINYDLRLWISEYMTNITRVEGRTFSFKIDVEVSQKLSFVDQLKNIAQASTDTFPNFAQISSETNGRGIYKYTEDGEDIYYWRGNIDAVATEENGIGNHVIFGGYCWEMVRTTKTGGVKMIYDGEPVEVDGIKICTNTSTASQLTNESTFQWPSHQDNAYVGYMYGMTGITEELSSPQCIKLNGARTKAEVGSESTKEECISNNGKWVTTAYEATHANVVNSIIKTAIDEWFSNSILNTEENLEKIEDAVYCNDRSIAPESNGEGYYRYMTIYGADYRLHNSYAPSLSCIRQEDRFTVNENNGNGDLTYPVGLITADEIMLAGGQNSNNTDYYLYTGQGYYSLSPYAVLDDLAMIGYLEYTGKENATYTFNSFGVRPVITLVPGTTFSEGSGTESSPYVAN